MKKILLFAALSLSLVACKSTSTKDTSVKQQETVHEVKETNVIETLKYLTLDELEGRDSGSKGIEKAAVYLENQFKQHNIKPYFDSYRDTLSNYKETSYNIVGLIEGTDPKLKNEYIILGAHYDHIGITPESKGDDKINNGANDNASGTTILSEIAKYIATFKNNKRSVLVVYFSAEERGLLGSQHLADKLKAKGFNLYAMLNFEMMGVPMTDKDFELYITGPQTSNMWDKLNEYAGEKLVGVIPEERQYQLFRASDNFPFYVAFNVPSQTVCSFDFKNYAYYHQPQDEFQLMDTKFMTSITQKMLPVVTKMINAETQEIQLIKK